MIESAAMGDVLRDVRLACRRLRAARTFTLFSVVTLAVGLGMTTAIVALIRGTVLKPPQIRDIGRVINIYQSSRTEGPLMALSLPDVRDFIAAQTSFDEIMAWRRVRVAASFPTTSAATLAEAVTGNYFDFVGAQPRLGRLLQPADDRDAAPPVVVVSEDFWRRALESNPNIVGEVISLNGSLVEIVGVAALPFQGVDMPNVQPTPMWVPLSLAGRLEHAPSDRTEDRDQRWVFVKARLRQGASFETAVAEVSAIAQQLDQAFPRGSAEERARFPDQFRRPWYVRRADAVYVHESISPLVGPAVSATLTMVVLVLLVTCTNLANLLLARGAVRRSEFAVRYALGASRWRVVREQLVESALLAALSAAAAIATARWATVQIADSSVRMAPGLQMQLTPAADSTVTGGALAATVIALVVFGLVPALLLTRRDLHPSLNGNDIYGLTSRWRGRGALIAAQVAVSVVLVTAAVFSSRQVLLSAEHDTGLDLEQFSAASIDFTQVGYDEVQARDSLRRIVDSVRRGPRGQGVALASGLPIGLYAQFVAVSAPGNLLQFGAGSAWAGRLIAATPELFDVIGVRASRGRLLRDADNTAAQPVAVISAKLASDVFGRDDVIGQSVSFLLQPRRGVPPAPPATVTIVGVVRDTDVGVVGRRQQGVIYVPFEQRYEPTMAVVVRSSRPDDTAAGLPELIRRADAAVAVSEVGTGVTLSGIENVPLRVIAWLTGVLGSVALVLAMSGLYGVLSYLVTGRRREIGIRRALGATPRTVLRLIVAEGLRPVAAGLVLGSAVGAAAWFAVARSLLRVPAVEPGLLVGVAALFFGAGLLACSIPARRAMRMEPSETLRQL